MTENLCPCCGTTLIDGHDFGNLVCKKVPNGGGWTQWPRWLKQFKEQPDQPGFQYQSWKS